MSLSYSSLRISGSEVAIHFKCDSKQLAWRDTNKGVTSYMANQLQRGEWTVVGPQRCMLCLTMTTSKGPVVHRLAGFPPNAEGPIRSHFAEHFKVNVASIKGNTSGRSWLTATIRDDIVRLAVPGSEEVIADIDKRLITNVVEPPEAPHEAVIQLDADRLHDEDDAVTEIRFSVPPGKQDFLHHMAEFKDTLEGEYNQDQSQVPIARLTDITLVLPRGKFEVQMFETTFRMHGKTASHVVEYVQVRRTFLLPKPDGKSSVFVMMLQPPLMQGKTEYGQLVLPLEANRRAAVPITGTREGLKPLEDGELSEVFPRVFQCISRQAPAAGPSSRFPSANGFHCVPCSHKTFEGHLYLLEDCFLFVNRPCTLVRYKDVEVAEFQRVDSGRTFDLVLVTRIGVEHQFSTLDKADLDSVRNFLHANKVGGAEPPTKQQRTE